MKSSKLVFVVCALYLCLTPGCASDGASCTASTQGDGIVLLTCEDGTTAVVASGTDGRDGVQGPAGLAGPDGPAGAAGPAGPGGAASLLKLNDEPIGDNCVQGGTRVSAGVDDNENGALDADEVDEESFVCNGDGQPTTGVLEGSIELRNTMDVLRYSGFDTVTGAMSVSQGLALVELPELVYVGALRTSGGYPGGTQQRILLTGLQRVYGDVYVSSVMHLLELELPALERVDGDLRISGNYYIRTLDFESLTHVGGNLSITNCRCIANEDIEAMFEGVTVIGEVNILNNGTYIGTGNCP